MSTRALYSFKDDHQFVTVYKHHDGYPEGAASWITKALENAWPLPRFEADEFAAAFVAANKDSPGGVRLRSGAGDAAYHYTVSLESGELWIEFFEDDGSRFKGSLAQMVEKFGAPFVDAA